MLVVFVSKGYGVRLWSLKWQSASHQQQPESPKHHCRLELPRTQAIRTPLLGERWGGQLNVLVNTVGPGAAGTFEQLTDEQWLAAVDDGAMGMVRCVRAALPLLRNADWARIVNFSAHSTQRQSVMLPAYTAAKSMVNSISKNLSLLLAADEIMVNVVSPGSIASEALLSWAETVGVDGADPYALMSAIDEHFGHPAHLPRAGLPDEIGPVAAFLASRRNSYMTGANVNVDGGSDFT